MDNLKKNFPESKSNSLIFQGKNISLKIPGFQDFSQGGTPCLQTEIEEALKIK